MRNDSDSLAGVPFDELVEGAAYTLGEGSDRLSVWGAAMVRAPDLPVTLLALLRIGIPALDLELKEPLFDLRRKPGSRRERLRGLERTYARARVDRRDRRRRQRRRNGRRLAAPQRRQRRPVVVGTVCRTRWA